MREKCEKKKHNNYTKHIQYCPYPVPSLPYPRIRIKPLSTVAHQLPCQAQPHTGGKNESKKRTKKKPTRQAQKKMKKMKEKKKIKAHKETPILHHSYQFSLKKKGANK